MKGDAVVIALKMEILGKNWQESWWIKLIVGIVAVFLLPFTVGGVLSYFLIKKVKRPLIKWSLVTPIALFTLFFGSAWVAAFVSPSSTKEGNPPSAVVTGTPSPTTPTQTSAQTKTPTPTLTKTPTPTPRKLSYEVTDPYWVGKERWKTIIVPRDTNLEELIDLAEEAHQKEPDTFFNIFDDKKELAAYKKWDISQNDPEVYFPEEWVKEHSVGLINKMLTTEGLKWQLYPEPSSFWDGLVPAAFDLQAPASTPTPAPTKTPTREPQREPIWAKLKSWQGSGTTNTEQFTITGSQWRVSYNLVGHPEFGALLQIYVYGADGSLIGLPVNTIEPGSGTSYMYKKGTFYLTINGAAISWSVDVEELR